MWHWWHCLSDGWKLFYAGLVIPILGILFAAARMFLRYLYAQTLVDLDSESARIKARLQKESAGAVGVNPESAVNELSRRRWICRPMWLIRRALNYQARRKKLKDL